MRAVLSDVSVFEGKEIDLMFPYWMRYLKLMRRVNARDGIVPEWLFDYWGNQHVVNHIHSYLYASQFAKGCDILDACCGSGYGTEMLALRGGGRTVGVDTSSDAIQYCQLVRRGANLYFVRMDVRCLAFGNASFDMVTSFEGIEHFNGHEQFFSEVARILRPGGRIVLATPNGTWRRMRGMANPYHVHEFTYDELRTTLERYFDDVQVFCRHFRTQEADAIEQGINEARNRFVGVRLLSERNRLARWIYLVFPHAFLDRYFRRRTGYPLNWFGPEHVRLEAEYSDEAYAFLATGVKR